MINLNDFKQKYDQLKATIIERQHLEATQPYEPYLSHETTINYTDVATNSLLHYAAATGDIDKIKYCLSQGADINLESKYFKLTPIGVALRYGHTEAANYLYEEKAKCLKLELESCHKNSKPWIQEKLKKALHEAFPDPRNLTEAKADNLFFRKIKSYNLTTFNSLKTIEEHTDPLTRAAEIGELHFIIAAREKNEKKVNEKIDSLLVTAAANGQRSVIEWLLAQGAKINNDTKYSNSALESAVKHDYPELVDYLLEQGADVNKQNNWKRTPIMTAILNYPIMVEKLLQKKPDLLLTDANGDNVLHHLARYATISENIQKLLLLNPKAKELLQQKNIYGFTPLDIATQNKNETFLKIATPENFEEIKKSAQYGHAPAGIHQFGVRQKMLHYLKSQYRDTTFFSEGGSCNGFTYLYHFYSAQGKEDYFFSTLELMANWDGKENSLFQPLGNIPQAKYYHNLAELFEQWINDVNWFQFSRPIRTNIFPYTQTDRQQQYYLVQNSRDLFPVYLFDFMNRNEEHEQSISDYSKLLNYLLKMPPGTNFEFGGDGHVTSAYVNDQGHLNYYDSNFLYRPTQNISKDEMIKRLINYKYLIMDQIADEFGEKSKINPYFRSFVYQKDQDRYQESLKNFKVFADNDFPKSKAEALQFQQNMPHHYSPLHIAVMTSSFVSLQKLLDDNHCDINARDADGLSAVDFAIKNHSFVSATSIFLNHPQVEIDNPPVTPYLKGDQEFAEMLLNNKNSRNLENLLYAAIAYDDVHLIEKLITQKKVDVNKTNSIFHSPLTAAIDRNAEGIIKLLLKYHADVLIGSNSLPKKIKFKPNDVMTTPLNHVIEEHPQFYPLLIQQLKNIDEFDLNGRTAIHWAIVNGQTEILKDLLQRGANINLKTKDGKDCFDLLQEFRNDSNEQDKYNACLKTILSAYQFDLTNANDKKSLLKLLHENLHTSNTEIITTILEKFNSDLAADCVEESKDEKLKQLFIDRNLLPRPSASALSM